jgi:hypothetical protein
MHLDGMCIHLHEEQEQSLMTWNPPSAMQPFSSGQLVSGAWDEKTGKQQLATCKLISSLRQGRDAAWVQNVEV